MSDSDNKSELIKFMVDYWRSNPDDVTSNLLGERELFATAGDLCYGMRATRALNTFQTAECLPLRCEQEEADTRKLFHALYAVQHGYSTEIVKSPDADVLVMAVGLSADIPTSLIFQTGIPSKMRFLAVHSIAEKLGPSTTDCQIT